jgi:hypothetical protein
MYSVVHPPGSGMPAQEYIAIEGGDARKVEHVLESGWWPLRMNCRAYTPCAIIAIIMDGPRDDRVSRVWGEKSGWMDGRMMDRRI